MFQNNIVKIKPIYSKYEYTYFLSSCKPMLKSHDSRFESCFESNRVLQWAKSYGKSQEEENHVIPRVTRKSYDSPPWIGNSLDSTGDGKTLKKRKNEEEKARIRRKKWGTRTFPVAQPFFFIFSSIFLVFRCPTLDILGFLLSQPLLLLAPLSFSCHNFRYIRVFDAKH